MNDNVKIKEIDGCKYTAIKLTPKVAWSLQLRVMKVFGPALKHLVELMGEKDETKRDAEAIRVFGDFLSTMNPDEVLGLLEEITGHAHKGGEKISEVGFDVAFADNHFTAIKVAVFVLGVTLGGFTNAITQSKLGQAMTSMTQP